MNPWHNVLAQRGIDSCRYTLVIHRVEKAISQNSQLRAYFSINLSDNKFSDEFLFDEGGAS